MKTNKVSVLIFFIFLSIFNVNGQIIKEGTRQIHLDFLKSGNYEIILRRWPYESGLHLNDSINTFIPSTKNWDELSYGKKLEIESAHLILDGVKSQIDITNNKEAKIQIYIESGIKDLETVFKLKGGEITTPLYVEIKYL